MSIKDVFLNNIELSFLYRDSLKGVISKNDLAETQKAQLIEFAKNEEFKALDFINKLLLGNPETTFEYWEQRHGNLNYAKKVLNCLITEQVEVKSVSIGKQAETKTDKLKAELGKYGFFELPKVKQLSEPNKQKLVELISSNGLPYVIAMLEFLGFIKHLKAEHFNTNAKFYKAVANCFEVDERAVKGNFYVLNEKSTENKKRYTAYQQKQTVQKDYESLK
jgi:hypothetical protein